MAFENDFIAFVRSQQQPGGCVILPAADDCAILKLPPDDLLIAGVDQVLEGVHFAPGTDPRLIGVKAMNRNLSDCAAMAAWPVGALCTLALRRGSSPELAKAIYLGIRQAGEAFDCPIVGGDTGVWDGPLAVTVTILGRSDGVVPVRRDGARPGDTLYLTGPVGGSILGRHLSFVPRIREARELAKTGLLSAMMDVSDGLAIDLHRLCQSSGVGAVLEAAKIPIHEDARVLAGRTGQDPLHHALGDGEDHELLFATRGQIEHPGVHRIGTIIDTPGIWIEQNGQRQPLAATGWEHAL